MSQYTKINNSSNENISYDIWASFIEQGLILLTDYISIGIPIEHNNKYNLNTDSNSNSNNNPNLLFPEMKIREKCHKILQLIILILLQNQLLRLRIMNSLAYSGNIKLRLNILTNLIYLCRNNKQLRKIIWEIDLKQSNNNNNLNNKFNINTIKNDSFGSVFHIMLSEIVIRDIKNIVLLINILRLNIELKVNETIINNENILLNENNKKQIKLNDNNCYIIINEFGTLTKMVCPCISIISYHSPMLGSIINSVSSNE